MQRFGYNIFFLLIFVFTAGIGSCTDGTYGEENMGPIATLIAVVMDIVSSEYIDIELPERIEKSQIKEIVLRNNTDFDELKYLDKYEMIIVSNKTEIAAVVWDLANDRKLFQDLRCTTYVDEHSWRSELFGSDFTLDWAICGQQ